MHKCGKHSIRTGRTREGVTHYIYSYTTNRIHTLHILPHLNIFVNIFGQTAELAAGELTGEYIQ